MKKLIFGLFLSTCLFTSIQAQVKIGENPENLHFNSVLELESTSKALVITRMSTLQMNAITPLNGAVIYNTDTRCLHYYNDTEWINLCEAENAGNINLVDNGDNTYTFTNAAGNDITFETPAFTSNHTGSGGVGFSSGIKITDDGNTVNIEVDQIHGNSILNKTIGRTKIADDAIGVDELGDTSVNTNNLIDESVTPVKIQPSATPNQVLKTNATGTNVEWGTLDATNIAGQDLTVDASLEFTGSTTGVGALLETVGISVADGGITNAKLAPDAITTTKIVDANVTTVKIADDAIVNTKVADDAVQTENILDGTITTLDIADDAITAIKINADVAGSGLTKNATTGALDVDVAALTGDGNITSTDLSITGGTNAALNDVTLEINPSAVGANELADGAVTTTKIVDANVTTVKIADDAIENTKLADDAVQTENILDGTITTLDIADDAITADKIGSAGAADANKILGTSAVGDPEWQNASEVAASLGEDVISSNGSISGVTANAALATMDLEVNVDNTTIEVDATNGLQIIAGSIDNTKLANDAVTGAKILDASIESNDIADKNITLTKLADGTAVGQLMQWDGTNWVLVDAATLTTAEADGIIGNEVTGPTDGTLAVSGTGTVADPLTLDVSADGIDTAELADNAVTTIKITDANVTTVKIQDNAITSAKILDDAITAVKINADVAGSGLTQNSTGNLDVMVDDTTIEVNGINELQIKNNSITANMLVNGAVVGGASGNIFTNSITQGDIASNAIGSGELQSDSVGESELKDDAVESPKILNETILSEDIKDGEIKTSDIADSNVTTLKIQPSTQNGDVLTTISGVTQWKAPAVVAMGKVLAAGSGNNNGATTTRNSLGNYTVTFTSTMPDADYIIQLTLLNAGANVSIEVGNQTINGFEVLISQMVVTSTADSSSPPTINSTISSNPIDSNWFFTVTDF
ncbi:hypothetical protein A5M85_03135 [Cellulophaga lytica]|uniref:beta strand repeat-containing protein n=1 Tax=Cellulophaga lytica TaxID=979 RepID=UPI000950832B|nr:hypothetical protein [Cellulophaga lytica]APU09313.1 hypothetical protein A5M85_03135 [Cellulophaga lytica]